MQYIDNRIIILIIITIYYIIFFLNLKSKSYERTNHNNPTTIILVLQIFRVKSLYQTQIKIIKQIDIYIQ